MQFKAKSKCPACYKEHTGVLDSVTLDNSLWVCTECSWAWRGGDYLVHDFNKWEAPQSDKPRDSLDASLAVLRSERHVGLPQAAKAALGILTEKETILRTLAFLNDLCHPEQYGHAVTAEVRARARGCATELDRLLEG
jgi:hypothetical protein